MTRRYNHLQGFAMNDVCVCIKKGLTKLTWGRWQRVPFDVRYVQTRCGKNCCLITSTHSGVERAGWKLRLGHWGIDTSTKG